MQFSQLPLHDATLASVHISWNAARCDFQIYRTGEGIHCLVFEGFTNLELPKAEPWGPSESINNVQEPSPGHFEIELQSGDTIRITAAHWRFSSE